MKNIFRNFGQQVLTEFWYWMSNMSKSPQKCQKRQLLTKNQGGFCNILFTAMIFGWEVAQGVYNNLRKQLQSYLWSSGKYWHKRFGHFYQFWAILTKKVSNFYKHFISQKTTAMVIWSFHDTPCKWNIQITHLNIDQSFQIWLPSKVWKSNLDVWTLVPV